MMRNFKLLSLVAVMVLAFGGCSDDGEAKKSTASSSAEVAKSGSIEIAKGDANEIKVAPKEHDGSNKAYYADYASDAKEPERSVLDANLHVRSPYERIQIELLSKQLSKNFIQKCSACHDNYANGIVGPSLLGKSVEHIEEKIAEFRKDRSVNVLMSDLVANMQDDEIRSLAKEIFDFNEEVQKMRGN
jgi:cytochrome c553